MPFSLNVFREWIADSFSRSVGADLVSHIKAGVHRRRLSVFRFVRQIHFFQRKKNYSLHHRLLFFFCRQCAVVG